MSDILVFVEHKDGKLKKTALELLTGAKKSGLSVHALALGPGSSALGSAVGEYGANTLFACDDAKLSLYNPEAYSAIISTVIKDKKPTVVLAAATSLGKDLFPRVGGA